MKKSKKIIWGIIITLAVLIAAGVIYSFAAGNKQKEDYEIVNVREGTVTPVFSASGSIFPENEKELSFEVSGEVVDVYVSVGEKVSGGQILAELKNDDLKLSYNQAENQVYSSKLQLEQLKNTNNSEIRRLKSQLDSAETALKLAEETLQNAEEDYNRIKEQMQTTSSPQLEAELEKAESTLISARSQYNQAVSSYEQAKITLESAEENSSLKIDQQNTQLENARLNYQNTQSTIDKLKLKAPFDGVVLAINIKKGDMVAAASAASAAGVSGNPHFVIAPVDWTPFISFSVDQTDISYVTTGMPVYATLDSHPDIVLEGTVTAVGLYPDLDNNSVVSYSVSARFSNHPDILRAGMTATLEIQREPQKGLVVPNIAVKYVEGVPKVTVLQDGEKIEKEITVGISDKENTIVKSGLKKGEKIVIEFGETTKEQSEGRIEL